MDRSQMLLSSSSCPLSRYGLTGDLGQLKLQPRLEIVEDRLCLFLPQGNAHFSGLVARLFLHGIECSNPYDRLFGDSGALALEDLHKLAAHVDHAGLLAGLAVSEQIVEAGEPIGMHHALISGEVT